MHSLVLLPQLASVSSKKDIYTDDGSDDRSLKKRGHDQSENGMKLAALEEREKALFGSLLLFMNIYKQIQYFYKCSE